MATVDETKSRLLRGVVQDNIEVMHGVKLQHRRRRKFVANPWWLAGLLALGSAYLLRPASVVLTGQAPASIGTQATAALNIEQTPESTVIDSKATATASIEPTPESSVIDSQATAPLSFEPTPESAPPLANPRPIDRATIPLAIKRIVIDPGHGGEPGAISDSGVAEKEITLDVALRLRRLLADAPYEVLLTRQNDRLIPLDKRVAFANENKADLFVSIHVNWLEPRTIRALETYYVGPSDDPATLRLASIENQDSGYSMSDYKKILEKIYVDARHDESRALARTIQKNLFRALKPINPVLENRGVKSAPFLVLIGTQMPAILVEICCLSNDHDVQLLTKADYRESIALALLQGIRGYARSLNGPGSRGKVVKSWKNPTKHSASASTSAPHAVPSPPPTASVM